MSEAAVSPPVPSLRRNALANVVGRATSALAWVFVTPYALARLGTEGFGVWALFFALGGYVAALDFGMASAVARFVALGVAHGEARRVRGAIARSLAISAGLGVLWLAAAMTLGAVFCDVFHVPAALAPAVQRALAVFGASMAVFAAAQTYQGALAGFQRLDLANAAFLAGLAVHVVALVVGLARGGGLVAAAIAALLGQSIVLLLSWVLSGHASRRWRPAAEGAPPAWRELLAFGGTVQVTNGLIVGQMQLGKLLLGALAGLGAVTVFELAYRVANAVWSLPVLMQGALVPAAARASAAGGLEEARGVYRWGARWIHGLAGPVLAGLALVAPLLFTLWLGPGHDETARVGRVLALAFALGTPAIPGNAVARGGGRPGIEAAGFGLALFFNVVGVVVWAPALGPRGAALALALSFAVMSVFVVVRVARWLMLPALALARVAAPRLVLPALAAAALAWAFAGVEPATRGEAVALLALQSGALLLLCMAAGALTGDSQVLLRLARARFAGARAGGAA